MKRLFPSWVLGLLLLLTLAGSTSANLSSPPVRFFIPHQPSVFIPKSMAVALDGAVWAVVETDQLLRFDPADPGVFTAIGSSGSGPGQLNYAQDVAIASSGDIYVADTFNNRIQRFDSAGNFVTAWGTAGLAPGEFATP